MKPTKARIELMQAIVDGAVTERYSFGMGPDSTWDWGPGYSRAGARRRYQRVSGRTAALNREGLIRIVEEPGTSRFSVTPLEWSLTDAGETWLKDNGGITS